MIPASQPATLLVAVATMVTFLPVEVRSASRLAADRPGAYCPLPEPGVEPECLAPARARYGPFFEALEQGEVDADEAARIEAELTAGSGDQEAYLALSSLAYAYWRLALRAAEAEAADPELVAQLQGWNALLSAAYERSPEDSDFRGAVRQAAVDLDQHSPSEGLQCLDASGQPTRCYVTTSLIERIDRIDGQLGVRGAIRRLLERMFGPRDT